MKFLSEFMMNRIRIFTMCRFVPFVRGTQLKVFSFEQIQRAAGPSEVRDVSNPD